MNRLSENKVMQNWPNEVLNLAHYSLPHLIALQRALIQLTWNEWVKLRRSKAEKKEFLNISGALQFTPIDCSHIKGADWAHMKRDKIRRSKADTKKKSQIWRITAYANRSVAIWEGIAQPHKNSERKKTK